MEIGWFTSLAVAFWQVSLTWVSASIWSMFSGGDGGVGGVTKELPDGAETLDEAQALLSIVTSGTI